jgi:hypothetical protein
MRRVSSEEEITSPDEYFGTPEDQTEDIEIQYTLKLTRQEVKLFEYFYRETDGCACAENLGAMYHYLTGETPWDREKIKRFLLWFVVKGLNEDWILAELGF